MTPESAAADIVLRLSDLASDSRENAQTVLQALLLELVEQNRVPQYDLELRDCHEQIAMLNRQLKAATRMRSEARFRSTDGLAQLKTNQQNICSNINSENK